MSANLPVQFREQCLINVSRILKDAQTSLTTKQTSDEQRCDKLRTDLSTYTKEKEIEILNRSNEIAALQLKLEQQLSFGTRLRVRIVRVRLLQAITFS